ncbi:MAG: hypothetical protein JNK48_35060 [Bryobacterales bacterium]|nr:hypothetical protein [Bryobacterales bacterium]
MYRRLDTGLAYWRWDLVFQDVSGAQRQSIDSLFNECRGSLLPFLFLDPFQNLVRHSEAFEAAAWEKEASIVATAEQADPFDMPRARRLSNASGAWGSVRQRLPVPAWVTYSVSCWLRANVPTGVEILAGPAGGTNGTSAMVNTVWMRHSLTVTHISNEEELDVGLRIPGNSEVYAYGFQLEPFATVSEYQKTTEESGVHVNCRFEQDEIRWVTKGVDHHSTRIYLRAPRIS